MAVLGATGMVGGAVVRAFAAHGASLVVHAHRNAAAAQQLATEASAQHGVDTIAVKGDVTEPDAMSAVRETVQAAGFSGIDILVICVTGYGGRPAAVAQLDVAEFRRVIDVDLTGCFVAIQALLPLLRAAGQARIVLFSSLAGVRGRPGAAHLCAAKAGVQGLALALARELGPQGIRVNCLAPGPVLPPGADPPPGIPGPNVGISQPEQVAASVLTLAAATAPVTGQLLVLNGGQP